MEVAEGLLTGFGNAEITDMEIMLEDVEDGGQVEISIYNDIQHYHYLLKRKLLKIQ